MKLSDTTIEILKNYSSINQSLMFRKGSSLTTMTPTKTVLAIAQVVEVFPSEFAIYDLNKFLAKISLYQDCDLEFKEDRVVFKSGDGRRTDYTKHCSPKVIVTPPAKGLSLDEPDYEFELTATDLQWQRKSAGVSGSHHFSFIGDGSSVYFQSTDVKDDSSDMSSTRIAETDGVFRCVMKVENFKMLEGSYSVKISKSGLVQFTNKDKPVIYYVAIESALSDFK